MTVSIKFWLAYFSTVWVKHSWRWKMGFSQTIRFLYNGFHFPLPSFYSIQDIHTQKFNMDTEVMVWTRYFLSTMSRLHKVVYFEETCQNSMFIIFLGFSPTPNAAIKTCGILLGQHASVATVASRSPRSSWRIDFTEDLAGGTWNWVFLMEADLFNRSHTGHILHMYYIIWYNIHAYAFSWEMIQQISWLFMMKYTILQKIKIPFWMDCPFFPPASDAFSEDFLVNISLTEWTYETKTTCELVFWDFNNSSLVHDSCVFFKRDRCRRPQPICTEYIYIYIYRYFNFTDVLFIVCVCVCVLCRLSRWHTFFLRDGAGSFVWFVSVQHRWKVVAFL